MTTPSTVNWLDLMNNAGTGFEPLPAGPYDCEVAKAEATQSSSGKHMWKVRFKVLAGPHANSTIFTNIVLSPDNSNALGFFFQHMGALGLSRDFFAQSPSPDTVADAILGRKARVTVKQKEYQGSIRNEVTGIAPLAGAAPATGPAGSTPAPPPPPPPAPATPPAAPPAPAPAPEPPTPPAPPAEPTPAAPPAPEISPGTTAPDPGTADPGTPAATVDLENTPEAPPAVPEPQPAPPVPAAAPAGGGSTPPPVPF